MARSATVARVSRTISGEASADRSSLTCACSRRVVSDKLTVGAELSLGHANPRRILHGPAIGNSIANHPYFDLMAEIRFLARLTVGRQRVRISRGN